MYNYLGKYLHPQRNKEWTVRQKGGDRIISHMSH